MPLETLLGTLSLCHCFVHVLSLSAWQQSLLGGVEQGWAAPRLLQRHLTFSTPGVETRWWQWMFGAGRLHALQCNRATANPVVLLLISLIVSTLGWHGAGQVSTTTLQVSNVKTPMHILKQGQGSQSLAPACHPVTPRNHPTRLTAVSTHQALHHQVPAKIHYRKQRSLHCDTGSDLSTGQYAHACCSYRPLVSSLSDACTLLVAL